MWPRELYAESEENRRTPEKYEASESRRGTTDYRLERDRLTVQAENPSDSQATASTIERRFSSTFHPEPNANSPTMAT